MGVVQGSIPCKSIFLRFQPRRENPGTDQRSSVILFFLLRAREHQDWGLCASEIVRAD
jgi:hypothetical protein